jgi:hypothetical protein
VGKDPSGHLRQGSLGFRARSALRQRYTRAKTRMSAAMNKTRPHDGEVQATPVKK